MILSDNETKVDMLNNKAIAKTVADVICDCDDRPISIGIHGDWGAGKSSILVMVEEELHSKAMEENEVVCIRFNGWQHQGFEDSKIALMSAIISELSKNEKLVEKTKDILKKLWKNINWLSVAKTAGSAAFSLATGLPPIGLLNNLFSDLKETVVDKDKVNSAIDDIGKFLTDSKVFEDNSMAKEFAEFQNSFEELLSKSKIKKLVVLIDDLDRCLPKVTIETLEAVRLFMFTKSTAFVVAADEAMIEYAVHNHFPDLPRKSSDNYDYSKRYLEKLIQVPFIIPALGQVESEMYITLLMISSQIKDNNTEFNALLSSAIEKMKKPWENRGFTTEDLQISLNDKYDSVNNEIAVANQISDILSRNTQGNPRKIKRFLNMLLLRKQMAEARGFGEAIQISILAKLMLAEYYFPDQYKELAVLTDDNGKCPSLAELERLLVESGAPKEIEDEALPVAVAVTRETSPPELPKPDEHTTKWQKSKDFLKWATSAPVIGDVDLRPYFFASKEREDFFFEQVKSEKLREMLLTLMSSKMVIANKISDIKSLTPDEAKMLFEQIAIKVKKVGDITTQPNGIEGLRALIEHHQNLENNLVSFIETFPVQTVGAWICTGWDRSIVTNEAQTKLRTYITELKTNGGRFTKTAAEAALK